MGEVGNRRTLSERKRKFFKIDFVMKEYLCKFWRWDLHTSSEGEDIHPASRLIIKTRPILARVRLHRPTQAKIIVRWILGLKWKKKIYPHNINRKIFRKLFLNPICSTFWYNHEIILIHICTTFRFLKNEEEGFYLFIWFSYIQ